jgi:hypothetical protein
MHWQTDRRFAMGEVSDSLYFEEHAIIICKAHVMGSNDYWVTLRGTGDRLSTQFQLIGIVENRQVRVNNWIPLEVAQHLQDSLDEAYKSYDEVLRSHREENKAVVTGFEPDNWGHMVKAGPIHLLPQTFFKVFSDDYVVLDDTRVHRHIVAKSRDEVNKFRYGKQVMVHY